MELRWEICIDCLDPEALAPFWEGLLGYERGGVSQTYLELKDRQGTLPSLLFQRVPEPKVTKNRLHLDLYTPHAEELLEKAVTLGAAPRGERVANTNGDGGWFQVLTDPAGNEFCICTETG